ncbi:MAG: hypothetical protein HZT41_07795 [Dechloromonas sp.]|nr:MAG: hypothetical protein HZT41_07795 [Dechloromonas sp.]
MGSQKKTRYAARDGSRFLALPHVVMDSPAFRNLSGPALRLLLDIAREYRGDNNGQLVACSAYLKTRGWNSNDTAMRARRELEASGLIVETRKGMRPNRAAWYALTWASLDWIPAMDLPRAQFTRSAYLK